MRRARRTGQRGSARTGREVGLAVDERRGPEPGVGGLLEPVGGPVDLTGLRPAAGDLERGLGGARGAGW